MKRVIWLVLLAGCTRPANPSGISPVDPKYGASLQVNGASQASDDRGLVVLVQVTLSNQGQVPLALNTSLFSVELPSGIAYHADWSGICPGDQLVGGHSATCSLSFSVPPPGLAVAVLYQLPDARVLRAPTSTQPCSTCGGASCHDLMTDRDNCGACGVRVDFCTAGMPSCRSGASFCAAGCTDTSADPANCGGCGHACPPGNQCTQGHCVVGCTGSDRNSCVACCESLQPAGSATYRSLFTHCVCDSPGDCAIDCQTDYCTTGTVSDFFCQYCLQQSTCDPMPQCQLDASCAAFVACADKCPAS